MLPRVTGVNRSRDLAVKGFWARYVTISVISYKLYILPFHIRHPKRSLHELAANSFNVIKYQLSTNYFFIEIKLR